MRNPFWHNPLFAQNLLQCSHQQHAASMLKPKRAVFADPPKKPKSSNTEKPTSGAETPSKPKIPEATGPSEAELIQTSIGEAAAKALATAQHAIKTGKRQRPENVALSEKMERVSQSLEAIIQQEKNTRAQTRKELTKLVDLGTITEQEAVDFLDMNPDTDEFKEALNKMTEPLNDQEKSSLRSKIYAEANQISQSVEQFEATMDELRMALNEAGDAISAEAHKDRAIREHSKYLGFDLKEGKQLRFQYKRQVRDPETGAIRKEPVYRTATIKRVFFGKTKATLNGEEREIPDLTPSVELEYDDSDAWDANVDQGILNTPDNPTRILSAYRLKQVVDAQNMSELIEEDQQGEDTAQGIANLESLINEPIAVGDAFEYHLNKTNKKVYISDIRKEENQFFNEPGNDRKVMHTVIELSEPVQIGNQSKTKLTLGEFAKWKRRVDARKPMSLEQLRSALEDEFTERNAKYNRKSSHYPTIKAEAGENLCYDTDPRSIFQIQEADDKGITLDNGSFYTPAAFLSWVVNNEVEKLDPEAVKERVKDRLEEKGDPEAEKKANAAVAAEQAKIDAREKAKQSDKFEFDADHVPPPAETASYLRQLWNDTYLLSMGDLYYMGSEIFEFIKRTLERRQKGRVGAVGKMALSPIYPHLGSEFAHLEQSAETQNVNHLAEEYRNMGIDGLNERLEVIGESSIADVIAFQDTKDDLKAVMTVMCEKGYLKWDDKILWKAINKIAAGIDNSLCIYEYDEQKIEHAIDAFWGADTYRDFRSKNNSAYDGAKNSHMDYARQLENDPTNQGGAKGRLQVLLMQHMHGENINPAEYEAYLHFAIEQGKLAFEDKIYFLLMGLTVQHGKHPHKTILDISRVSEIGGKLENRFPPLAYFTNPITLKDPESGEVKTTGRKFNKQMAKWIVDKYIAPGNQYRGYSKPEQFQWPSELSHFVKSEILTHPTVYTRLAEKASMDCGNWDHDDMHRFVPKMGESQISRVTIQSGSKQQASVAGLLNAYAGFNDFAKLHIDEMGEGVAERDSKKTKASLGLLVKNLRSFIRMDSILQDRYKHGSGDYTRLSTELKSMAGVDQARPVRTHIQEMHTFIDGMIKQMKASGVDNAHFKLLEETWSTVKEDTRDPNQYSGMSEDQKVRARRNKQAAQEAAVDQVGELLHAGFKKIQEAKGDNGLVKMIQEVQGGGTIKGILGAPKSKQEQEEVAAAKLEL